MASHGAAKTLRWSSNSPDLCHLDVIVTELEGWGGAGGASEREKRGLIIWTSTHRRFVKEPKCSYEILKNIASTLSRSPNSVKTKLYMREGGGGGGGSGGRSLLATCVTLYDVAANCL